MELTVLRLQLRKGTRGAGAEPDVAGPDQHLGLSPGHAARVLVCARAPPRVCSCAPARVLLHGLTNVCVFTRSFHLIHLNQYYLPFSS